MRFRPDEIIEFTRIRKRVETLGVRVEIAFRLRRSISGSCERGEAIDYAVRAVLHLGPAFDGRLGGRCHHIRRWVLLFGTEFFNFSDWFFIGNWKHESIVSENKRKN